MDKTIFISTILYTILIIIALPLLGIIINVIVAGILKRIFRFIDTTGGAYSIFMNFLTIPGVAFHEISHALFAFITGAKVIEIKLYEFSNGHLGYVKYMTRGPAILRSIQLALASAAPVLTGLIASPLILSMILYGDLSKGIKALLSYLFVSILCHMDMSSADLYGYIKGVPWCFVICFALMLYLQSKGIVIVLPV